MQSRKNSAPLALAIALIISGTSLGQREANAAAPATAAAPVQLDLTPVQGNVYMLTGLDVNVAVQVGDEGILLVDTPPAALVDRVLEMAGKLTKRQIRHVINTHADPEHIGGDEALVAAGTPAAQLAALRRMGIAAGGAGGGFTGTGVTVLAHESVLNRVTDRKQPVIAGATITSEYYQPTKDFFFNGDPIILYHTPNAHSNGDSLVYFRRSDVVVTGDIFTPGRFPVIDLEQGGSIQGLIKAVNLILEITVPAAYQERGTYVIPGHGRLCDEADVSEFREMVTVVRDRVQALIKEGKTLEQVQAARPALDYETTYGGKNGGPTAAAFVETVFKSLTAPPQGA